MALVQALLPPVVTNHILDYANGVSLTLWGSLKDKPISNLPVVKTDKKKSNPSLS